MDSVDALMAYLAKCGMEVKLGDKPGQLMLGGPKEERTPALMAALTKFKPQLLERLNRGENRAVAGETESPGDGRNRSPVCEVPGADLLPGGGGRGVLRGDGLPAREAGAAPAGGKPVGLEVVAAWREWLTAETGKLREAVADAERWLAKWELDATFTDEVERAQALLDAAVSAWKTHVALCEWFAGWSASVLRRQLNEVGDFAGLRL